VASTDGRDEPATWAGRQGDSSRALPVLRLDQADAVVDVSATTSHRRRAADGVTNATYSDAAAPAVQDIIYVGALSVLLDIDETKIQGLFGEQFKGKKADRFQRQGAAARPRLGSSSISIPTR